MLTMISGQTTEAMGVHRFSGSCLLFVFVVCVSNKARKSNILLNRWERACGRLIYKPAVGRVGLPVFKESHHHPPRTKVEVPKFEPPHAKFVYEWGRGFHENNFDTPVV